MGWEEEELRPFQILCQNMVRTWYNTQSLEAFIQELYTNTLTGSIDWILLFFHLHGLSFTQLKDWFHNPACIPKPGPFGSSVKEVSPVMGSEQVRPLRGPGFGRFPALSASSTSSTSFNDKSSWKKRKLFFKRKKKIKNFPKKKIFFKFKKIFFFFKNVRFHGIWPLYSTFLEKFEKNFQNQIFFRKMWLKWTVGLYGKSLT